MTPVRVVIFAKAPVPGKVKTRLIPALGADGAARLAVTMLERTVQEAIAASVGAVELCADPAPDDWQWDRSRYRLDFLSGQGEGDLGERLSRAAKRVIEAGEAVILIGTDCPELDRRRLRMAAEDLQIFDAVMHPTLDGGYAMLGLLRYDSSLFEGVGWSTPAVAAETIARIRALGWRLRMGETLRDIDEPADLAAAGLAR